MKHTLMGLMMAAFLGTSGLEAQEMPTVQVGDSVRVLFRNLDLTGTLVRITGDSVFSPEYRRREVDPHRVRRRTISGCAEKSCGVCW